MRRERMVNKPMSAGRKATGKRGTRDASFSSRFRITGRIRAYARPERALT